METLPEITFLFNQGLAIVAQALNSPSPASYSSGPELTISVSCAEMTAMSHSQLPMPFLTNMQCLQGFQRLQSWDCKKSYSDRTNSVYTKTRQEPGSQFKHTASRVWEWLLLIPGLRRLRQENRDFEANLVYVASKHLIDFWLGFFSNLWNDSLNNCNWAKQTPRTVSGDRKSPSSGSHATTSRL